MIAVSSTCQPSDSKCSCSFLVLIFLCSWDKGKEAFVLFVICKLYFRMEIAPVDKRTFFMGKSQPRNTEGMTTLANHNFQSY